MGAGLDAAAAVNDAARGAGPRKEGATSRFSTGDNERMNGGTEEEGDGTAAKR